MKNAIKCNTSNTHFYRETKVLVGLLIVIHGLSWIFATIMNRNRKRKAINE